jgi:hypothetical protein
VSFEVPTFDNVSLEQNLEQASLDPSTEIQLRNIINFFYYYYAIITYTVNATILNLDRNVAPLRCEMEMILVLHIRTNFH